MRPVYAIATDRDGARLFYAGMNGGTEPATTDNLADAKVQRGLRDAGDLAEALSALTGKAWFVVERPQPTGVIA